MSGQLDSLPLRAALAKAEHARDEALAEAAEMQRRWNDERRESQHRLRNMFSVIRVVARRTADDVESVEDYCGALDSRLSSYLGVQAAVMQDWNRGSDLALLLAGELLIFGLKEGERVDLAGPPIKLTSRAAGLLVFAFHELAFAAVMSGRFDESRARILVSWSLDVEQAEPMLLIDWSEISPSSVRDEEPKSSWAEWVEQAIEHQLAGISNTSVTNDARTTRFSLPVSNTC